MAQVIDRTVGANPTGFDMRTELNNIIGALESDNSGSSEPLNTVAYMKWLDTSNNTYYYYKERNHDNTAWVTLFRYTVATKVMEVVNNGVVLQDSELVHKTGNETIAGVKTFSSSPIVPTPSSGTQAVNKDYVDSKPTLSIGAILNGFTIFDNCIVAFGGEFNRADYPKLWAYLQANPSLVKTQAEWTTENTTNGMCGYYSSGNGTTTFRVPNLDKAFLRPDSRTVGSFQEGSYDVGDSGGTTPAVDGLINYDDNSTAFRSRMNWDAITTVSIGAANLRGAAASPTLGTYSYQSLPTEFGVTRPKNIAVLPLIVAK